MIEQSDPPPYDRWARWREDNERYGYGAAFEELFKMLPDGLELEPISPHGLHLKRGAHHFELKLWWHVRRTDCFCARLRWGRHGRLGSWCRQGTTPQAICAQLELWLDEIARDPQARQWRCR